MKFSPADLGPSDSQPVIFGKSPLSASPMNGGTNNCTLRIAAQIAINAGSGHEVKIRRAALITFFVSGLSYSGFLASDRRSQLTDVNTSTLDGATPSW